MIALLALALLGSNGCGLPVHVRNGPERPVPTAPMGVETDAQGQITAQHNPQLGEAPTRETYENQGPGLGRILGAAVSGNWVEVGLGVIALLTGGGVAVQQRQKTKERRAREKAEKQYLAKLPPDEAVNALREQTHG